MSSFVQFLNFKFTIVSIFLLQSAHFRKWRQCRKFTTSVALSDKVDGVKEYDPLQTPAQVHAQESGELIKI